MTGSETQQPAISLEEVTAITWEDSDGTRYRRTLKDGEISDEEVDSL